MGKGKQREWTRQRGSERVQGNESQWDGMGQDSMGQHGMGWMGWDRIGWDRIG